MVVQCKRVTSSVGVLVWVKMSEFRKYESGAQKRKSHKLKEARDHEILNKIPKLTGYFKPAAQSTSSQLLLDASVTDDELANVTPATAPGNANAAASSSFDNEATAPATTSSCQSFAPAAVGAAEKEKGPEEEESVPVGPTSPTPIPINVPMDSYSSDPACWGEIDDSVRAYWARMGPGLCQNKEADVNAAERQYKLQKRHFSKSLFQRKLANGESVPREWLLYSPSKGAVFCFACQLFGDRINQQSHPMPFSNDAGYCDWKHANERLTEHEGSESHRKAMLAYIMHAADEGQID